MSATVSADPVLEHLPAHKDSEWLAERRARAVERLRTHGFPGPKSERWKGTQTSAFLQPWPQPAKGALDASEAATHRFPELSHVAVLVDGHFSPELSHLGDLPHAVHVESLAAACARGGAVLDEHLDATGRRDDPFADWNMAAWEDGLFVTTAERTVLEQPLHVLHVRTNQAGTGVFPRTLVHLRDGSELTVIEHHAGAGDAVTATIAVTELVAHPNSILRHQRIQESSPAALHMHSVFTRSDEDARIELTDASLGGHQSRLSIEGSLVGTGAELAMHGLFLIGGKQRTDVWSRFDHAVPHTSSQQLVKGVLGDETRGSFTGNVLVREGAQKTSAEQENRNLLLSNAALMDAQPQLEIHADDVQCSHGSTVGQLDDDALFFLRSRGIGHEDARMLLTKAFLADAVEAMHPAVRDGINQRIDAWFARHPPAMEVPA